MRSCVWVAPRRGSSAGAQLQSRGFVRAGLRRSFFDDAAMLAYVSRRWPRVFQSFCHLHVVEQSDLFRLMYIYDYGGVWSDMDVDLKHPPDRWVELYADAAGLRRKALGCTLCSAQHRHRQVGANTTCTRPTPCRPSCSPAARNTERYLSARLSSHNRGVAGGIRVILPGC